MARWIWQRWKKEALSELELKSVLHKQGLSDYSQVEKCVLEPSGNFYVEQLDPFSDRKQRSEILEEVRMLTVELREVKALLGSRE